MKLFHRWVIFIFPFLLMALVSCHFNAPSKPPVPPPSEDPKQVFQDIEKDLVLPDPIQDEKVLLTPEQFESFEIVRSSFDLREDGGETLFVLVPPHDLKLGDHIPKIKNLIKKLIVLEKRSEHITILIFDNKDALDKVYLHPDTDDLNVPVHYLARYMGSPEKGVYRNNLFIFPVAPDSNPAVKSMQDIIDFDPYEW